VSEHGVVNASPLIVLARAGQLDLLASLADEVVIPREVALEIEAGPAQDEARQALAEGQFTLIDTPPPPPELIAWDLGAGETAVLSLAIADSRWTALLDDAATRKCARSFSVPLKGTLAVVMMAKQQGLIPSAAEVIRGLVSGGFRLDDAVIRQALAQTVGEQWP
jgi:predicted nucleic acid-binding protein